MSAGSSLASPSTNFWSGSAGQGSVRSSTSRHGDPPRQAKEGREWVWFPEGYWAERQIEHRNTIREPSASQTNQGSSVQCAVTKVFKWGQKGGRSPKENQTDSSKQPDCVTPSPMTAPIPSSPSQRGFSQFAPSKHLPSSPYMSEEQQTFALQHPKGNEGAILGNRDTWIRLDAGNTPIAERISLDARPPAQPTRPNSPQSVARRNKEVSYSSALSEGPDVLTFMTGRISRRNKRGTSRGA